MLLNQVNNDNEEYLSCYSFKGTDNPDHDEERKTIINEDRLAIRKALAILEQQEDYRKKANRRRKSSSLSSSSNSDEQISHHDEDSSYSSLGPEKKRRTSSRKRRLNVVRFSNHDQVVHIPHILDIPQKEIDQCWMNEEDHSFIRSRSLRLIEMMEDEKNQHSISVDTNTMIVNNHLVCVRGLEEKTSTRVYERDERQRKLYNAVFRVQQQHRQQERRGVVDHQEVIRQASKKYSKKSTRSARLVGLSDEANASYSSRKH